MARSRSEYENELNRLVDRYQDLLQSRVRGIQRRMFDSVQDVLDGLSTDQEGRIVFTVGNLSKVEQVVKRVTAQHNKDKSNFLRWIIRKVSEIVGLNRLYFRSFNKYDAEKIDDRVRRLVLRRLGFDIKTNSIVPGGWLDTLSDAKAVAQIVGRDVNNAIAAKVPLSEFRQQFRQQFIGRKGLGYLERHYETFVFDLFQQVDRETQNQYATSLNLEYARYAGTIKNNTRPFCRDRVGKVYTRDEIMTWQDDDFKGKLQTGYNPVVHLGGYNCRHHLRWVSREYLERRGILDEVNTYN